MTVNCFILHALSIFRNLRLLVWWRELRTDLTNGY
uniref:Uncharacterized protein n=1 Tax=Anguilla anguilla TaxID=7936 RepID=A0A0E9VYJ6_ANGAN